MSLARYRLAASTLIGVAALSLQTGCATYTAVKIPGPVADERIALGSPRSEVELVLKTAPVTEYREGDRTIAQYQYKDGPHEASKGRVVLYIAGDVFTAFLSELIFWPIEAYASKQTERIAVAQYDADNRLVGWSVDRSGGERLVSLGDAPPESALAISASTAEGGGASAPAKPTSKPGMRR